MDDKADKKYWVALNLIPGIGQVLSHRLIEYFGDPKKIFSSSPKELARIEGIGPKLAQELTFFKWEETIAKELRQIENRGIKILHIKDENYPTSLRNIPTPPILLYVLGDIREMDQTALAIVGSRSPTPYGKWVADGLGRALAETGFTIVSGMARGIDSIAHRAALAAGGKTIAVLGSGLEIIYPPENKGLMQKIPESGAVVSEFPLFTKPEKLNFPIRNRIISGLSLGVIVIEAAANSGSLITATHALEQDREVFAVPGNIQSPKSKGSNRLIKKGAKLVEDIEDVLEELPMTITEKLKEKKNSPEEKKTEELDHEEKLVYSLISAEGADIDYLVNQSRLPANRIASLLIMLELKGLTRQAMGKIFRLKG
jgi:DNA processing protein